MEIVAKLFPLFFILILPCAVGAVYVFVRTVTEVLQADDFDENTGSRFWMGMIIVVMFGITGLACFVLGIIGLVERLFG